ncbi:MAG: hypothetical protein FK733_19185 [Asgard group archaeon]|nr:hypothetical protein [Asgard group archaeon]
MKKKFSLCLIAIFVIPICFYPAFNLQSESVISKSQIKTELGEPIIFPPIAPFFNLLYKAYDGTFYPEYADLVKQQLDEIGINISIVLEDWGAFLDTLLVFRDYDITSIGFGGGGGDPLALPNSAFRENGSLNIWGYHTSMDYDEVLGTGLNEWYINQGNLIFPPDSQERVQNLHDWQNHLISDILPMTSLFAIPSFYAYWSNLEGFNYAKGDILDNWGFMSWDGIHPNQTSTAEVTISYDNWTELNPLYSGDEESAFIIDACLDELLYIDADNSIWPHLAESWSFVDDSTLDITLRDGIEWMDYGGFTNEYLDADDLYFSLYCWQELSVYYNDWQWIDSLEVIDDMTLRIHIDGDPDTPEIDPYIYCLDKLNDYILPEHFLNQTQEADGITPDITHSSWVDYSSNCWGTDLFEINVFTEAIETILTVKSDCWRLNPTITNDPGLNYEERFGDYSGGLSELRVRIMDDHATILSEFEYGKLDMIDITSDAGNRSIYKSDSKFEVQSAATGYFNWLGFNLREVRNTPLQSTDPCPLLPSMTKGLAIRKAIAYAINRTEINNISHNDEFIIWDYPNYPTLGIWNDPDLIRYDCNLTKAKEYMMYAGYDCGLDSDSDGLSDYIELTTTNTDRFNNDTDRDGLDDGEEVNTYFTDPLDIDTDGDIYTDYDEVNNGSDPLNPSDTPVDTDNDGLSDGYESIIGTNPSSNDSDSDGLLDGEEFVVYSTDPLDSDSDDDLLLDGEEVNNYLTDPLDPDSDDDLIDDWEEVNLGSDGYHTNPNDSDTDSDGLDDYEETTLGSDGHLTDPTDSDSDDDTLNDSLEQTYGTDPNSNDTETDGMPDAWEIANSLDPLLDDSSLDSDLDGLDNLLEYQHNTDPQNNDTDNDLIPDGWEIDNGLNPLNITDAGDDPDADGLTNLEEYTYNTDPNDEDTDDDSYTDKEEIDAGTDPLDPNSMPTEEADLHFPITLIITMLSFAIIISSRRRK